MTRSSSKIYIMSIMTNIIIKNLVPKVILFNASRYFVLLLALLYTCHTQLL